MCHHTATLLQKCNFLLFTACSLHSCRKKNCTKVNDGDNCRFYSMDTLPVPKLNMILFTEIKYSGFHVLPDSVKALVRRGEKGKSFFDSLLSQ